MKTLKRLTIYQKREPCKGDACQIEGGRFCEGRMWENKERVVKSAWWVDKKLLGK